MKHPQRMIYNAFSFFNFLWAVILRMLGALGILYLLFYYQENPIVIIIAIAFVGLYVFLIGDDQAIVYEDKIVFKTNSFLSLIFKSYKEVYVKDISRVFLQKKPKTSFSEAVAAGFIFLIFPGKSRPFNSKAVLCFELKKEGELKVETDLEMRKVNKLIKTINELVQ